MKIMLVIVAAIMLSSCRVESDSPKESVFSGITKQDPHFVTADFEMDNNKYRCFSFDSEKDNLFFMCKKVKNEENSSSSTSTN